MFVYVNPTLQCHLLNSLVFMCSCSNSTPPYLCIIYICVCIFLKEKIEKAYQLLSIHHVYRNMALQVQAKCQVITAHLANCRPKQWRQAESIYALNMQDNYQCLSFSCPYACPKWNWEVIEFDHLLALFPSTFSIIIHCSAASWFSVFMSKVTHSACGNTLIEPSFCSTRNTPLPEWSFSSTLSQT